MRLFDPKLIVINEDMLKILEGKGPTRWLFLRMRCASRGSRARESGIGPVRELLYRSRSERNERLARCGEIVPLSAKLERLRLAIR